MASLGPDLGASSLESSLPAPLDAINPLVLNDNWGTIDTATPTFAPPAPRRASYIAPAYKPTAGWKIWLFSLTLLPLGALVLIPEPTREERPAVTEDEGPDSDPIVTTDEEPTLDDGTTWQIEETDSPGAHLSRDSWMHWFYALLSAGIFFGLIVTLFQQGQATPKQLIGAGLLTATCGVASLIMFQWIASGSTFLRFYGILGVIALPFRLIGFSYAAALDPDTGFFLSLVGFTFGVGLCEEFIKAIPIFARYRNEDEMDWRGACAWGLASGAGFGIAEGIMYSSDYYNGIAGVGMYVVRFVSCVGLHSIWTASVGIMLWHHQEALHGDMEWLDWGVAIAKVQGVVMLLHGLYDTLLKREMSFLALLVAIASFGYLVGLIQWTMRTDHRPAQFVRS